MKAAFCLLLTTTIVVTANVSAEGDAIAQLRGKERKLAAYYGKSDAVPEGCFDVSAAGGFEPKWGHAQGLLSQSLCDHICKVKGYRFSATTNFDWPRALEQPKMCLCANYGRRVIDAVPDSNCFFDKVYKYYHVKEVTPKARNTPYSGTPVKEFQGCWHEDNMPRTEGGLGGNTITVASPDNQSDDNKCQELCYDKGFQYSWHQPGQGENGRNYCSCLELPPTAPTFLATSDPCTTGGKVFQVWEETSMTIYSSTAQGYPGPIKEFQGCWGEDNFPQVNGNSIIHVASGDNQSDDNKCQELCYDKGFDYSWHQPGQGENGYNYCSCLELPPQGPLYISTQTDPCTVGGKVFQVSEVTTPAQPATPTVTWYNRNTSPATTATWQTWNTESAFCAAQGQQLCSYDTLCPGGIGSEPVGFTANHDRWAAVASSASCPNNSWVQIGKWNGQTTHYCKPHENFAGCPSWGVKQLSGTAYYHENIACCTVV